MPALSTISERLSEIGDGYNYLEHSLIPGLERAGDEALAKRLRARVLRRGLARLQQLDEGDRVKLRGIVQAHGGERGASVVLSYL